MEPSTLKNLRVTRKPSKFRASFEMGMLSKKKTKSGAPLQSSKYHLLNLPQEIRDEINKYLLTNPILGTCSSVTMVRKPEDKDATSPKYDLYPVVLRVCRQLYAEGREMLYERNVFFMDCTNWLYRNDTLHDRMPYLYLPAEKTDLFPLNTALNVTPLIRYSKHQNVGPTDKDWLWEGNQFFSEQPTLSRLLGSQVSYVRKWKVVVNGDAGAVFRRFDRSALGQFCHAIHQRAGLSLSFIICVETSSEEFRENADIFEQRLTFDEIFSPLKLLRRVDNVEFRESHCDNEVGVPHERNTKELLGYIQSIFPSEMVDATATVITSEKLEEKYKSLMKGSSQLIDPINLMCDNLVEYAQTFERVLELKQDIDMGTDTNEILFQEDTTDPFKRPYQPNQNLIRGARGAALFNEMSRFKVIRKQVLRELEKQYEKINESFAQLYNFIKQDRIFRGMVSAGGEFDNGIYTCQGYKLDLNKNTREKRTWQMVFTKSLLLLEDYAASFSRDMTNRPSRMRVEHRLHDRNHIPQELPREQLMQRIRDAYVAWDYSSFLQYFKEAVDNMDAQFTEIREAKKNLFQWDSGRTLRGFGVVDFETIAWDEIEQVRWTVLDFDYNYKRSLGGPVKQRRLN